MRNTLWLLVAVAAACTDVSGPQDGVVDPDLKPQFAITSAISGPDSIPGLGTFQWTVNRTSTDCVKWYRIVGNDTTLVKSDPGGSGQSTYAFTATDPYTPAFRLKAQAQYNTTCGSSILSNYVTLDVAANSHPLKPLLSTAINGPFWISTAGNYTWSAATSGGTGSYSHQWKIYFHDWGYWSSTTTGSSRSLGVTANDQEFEMYLTTTSGNQTSSATMFVCNFIPPNLITCT